MSDLNELSQGKVLLHKCPKCGKVYKYVVAEKVPILVESSYNKQKYGYNDCPTGVLEESPNITRLYTDFGDENIVVGNNIYSLCCGEPVDLNNNLYTLICDDFVADRFFNTKC